MSPHLLAEHLIDGSFRRLKGPDHSIVLSFSISCRFSLSNCFPPHSHVIAHSVRSSLAFWSLSDSTSFPCSTHLVLSLSHSPIFGPRCINNSYFCMDFLTWELSTRAIRVIMLHLWHTLSHMRMHAHTHTVKHKWTRVHTFSDAREGSQVLKSRFWSHECSKKDNQKQWWWINEQRNSVLD